MRLAVAAPGAMLSRASSEVAAAGGVRGGALGARRAARMVLASTYRHDAARSLCARSSLGSQPPSATVVLSRPWWADAVGLIGFCLIGVQWMMDDMLTLRAVGVGSSLCMVGFNLAAAGRPLWIPVVANSTFIAINAVQITRILRERQEIVLAEHERLLFDGVFRQQGLTKRQVRSLLEVGVVETRAPGESLATEGGKDDEPALPFLDVIVSGRAAVQVAGRTVAELSNGDFVGETSFVLGEASRSRPAVTVIEPVTSIRWEADVLRAYFHEHPVVHHALSEIWNRQLVSRLRHMTERARMRATAEALVAKEQQLRAQADALADALGAPPPAAVLERKESAVPPP